MALCIPMMACTDESDADDFRPGAGSLKFSVAAGAQSRVAYEGEYSTAFEDGDVVGCVIAGKNADGSFAYKTNTCWHYNAGVLVLDSLTVPKMVRVYPNPDNKYWYYEETRAVNCHYTDELNTWITRSNPGSEDGQLTLMDKSLDYAFFFYYPYITDDAVTKNISNAIGAWTSGTPFCEMLDYPNWATNETLVYENNAWGGTNTLSPSSLTEYFKRYFFVGNLKDPAIQNQDNTLPKYEWTSFPSFVNRVQKSKKQFENSDFLWTSYTADKNGGGNINVHTATYPVSLVFRKKTAVIEVDCDTELSDVEFGSRSGVLLGSYIDLQTGVRSKYKYTYDDGTKEKNCSTTAALLPRRLADGRYRLILPPQDNFDCDLNFTLNGNRYSIALEDNIEALQEGKIYIIHIDKAGSCTLKINDWESGYLGTLDEA